MNNRPFHALICKGLLKRATRIWEKESVCQIFKVEKNPTDDSKLILTINRQPIDEWFREQWEKLQEGLLKNRRFKKK